MAKFKVHLKIQGLELNVEGEREEIPIIAATVREQLNSVISPAEVVADVPKQLRNVTEIDSNGSAKGGRGSRKRSSGSKAAVESSTPIEFRHDSAKYGNPVQGWSIIEKCIWLLYVLKNIPGVKEAEPGQLVATFNEDFKAAGKLHPPLVARELGKAKGANPAPVGEDKGLWFLTDEGDRQAQALVKNVTSTLLS